MVKNPPAMWENSAMRETWVQSLGQEESLEEEMATHSKVLVWRVPWTEEPGGLPSMGLQTHTTEQLSTNVKKSD